jgi:transcriptional regulator with XRE-family HTH domain
MKISREYKRNLEEDNWFYIELGKRLKQARYSKIHEFTGKAYVVTQSAVAKAANTTFQQIQKYEKGQNRIPIINLIKISKFLNKPLDYFLDDFNGTEKLADKFNTAFEKEVELLEEQK